MASTLLPRSSALDETDRHGTGHMARAGSSAMLQLMHYRDFEAAEPVWQALQREAAHTAYQRLDWVRTWARHLGERVELAITAGFDTAGQPVFLWPMGVERGPVGLRVARWLGGKHANYKMGLYRRDAAGALDPATLSGALAETARAFRIDAFALVNQPHDWQGFANPMADLASQEAVSHAWVLRMQADYEAMIAATRGSKGRRRLRWRERRLTDLGALSFAASEDVAEATTIAEIFLEQKAARFGAQGRANAFDEHGAAAFIRDLAAQAGQADPPLLLYALRQNGETLATCGGSVANGRFSASFNSITDTPAARFSPTEVLIARILEDLCARGVTAFDLGVGDSPYKEIWCERERLFDTFLAVGAKGRLAVPALKAAYTFKRMAKRNPAVVRLANRFLRGHREAAQNADAAPDETSAR